MSILPQSFVLLCYIDVGCPEDQPKVESYVLFKSFQSLQFFLGMHVDFLIFCLCALALNILVIDVWLPKREEKREINGKKVLSFSVPRMLLQLEGKGIATIRGDAGVAPAPSSAPLR